LRLHLSVGRTLALVTRGLELLTVRGTLWSGAPRLALANQAALGRPAELVELATIQNPAEGAQVLHLDGKTLEFSPVETRF